MAYFPQIQTPFSSTSKVHIMSFGENLDRSLVTIYNYASSFRVSLELIQKLAQQLKLDTFVDKDAHTHVIAPLLKQARFQRLSIAGSLILLDIDFIDDSTILRASLSLANHTTGPSNGDLPKDVRTYIASTEKDNDGTSVVAINYTKDNSISFLKATGSSDASLAEDILTRNLTAPVLGNFPANLKYLTSLDRLSSSTFDLFLYLDNISLLLCVINRLERDAEPEPNWLIDEGLENNVGLVRLNDPENLKIGIFVNFWRDFRHINHEYSKSQGKNVVLTGKEYSMSLTVSESDHSSVDYLSELHDEGWDLKNSAGELQRYKFHFENLGHRGSVSGASSAGGSSDWALSLNFNHPVYLPTNLLEFLGISVFETHKGADEGNQRVFEHLKNGTEFDVEMKKLTKVSFEQRLTQSFAPVTSVELSKLSDLPLLTSIFRNYIVMTNLIATALRYTVSESPSSGSRNGVLIKSSELTAEAKKKLRESLKLPEDVTDEELLGLNVISDTNAYVGIQVLKPTVDLETFMKSEDDEDIVLEREDRIKITLEDAAFDNALTFSIDAHISQNGVTEINFSEQFQIDNGQFKTLNRSEDVDMDTDNTHFERLISGLNLTEDLLKTIKWILKDSSGEIAL